MDKYEALYSYSQAVYKERFEAFQHIQEKAAKYFSVLTFLLGFAIYYFKWFYEQNQKTLLLFDYIILFVIIALIIFLSLTWFKILSILRVEKFKVLPLNKEVLDFYSDNNYVDINYTMAKGIVEAIQYNEKVYDTKSEYLNDSYNLLKADTILILFSLILYIIKQIL